MKNSFRIFFFTQLFFILVTCANAEDLSRKTDYQTSRLHILHLSQDYTIGKGDVLEVFVWRNEQLSRRVVVRPDGKISLPFIQDLRAEGFTPVQLKNRVTRELGQHIASPQVSVIVSEINSYRVSVLGRVNNPGVYPITGKTTIAEAIALAGGFTEWANRRKITVVTHQEEKEIKVIINYKKISSGKDPSQNIILKRDDIVIVP
jgi:polysaccharide export outer membrane protein